MGGLRWLATFSSPDIYARLARIASRVNFLQGSDIYRVNDMAKTVKERRRAAVLMARGDLMVECGAALPKYLRRVMKGRSKHFRLVVILMAECGLGEKRCVAVPCLRLAGRTQPIRGQAAEGKCRSAYVVGL